MDRYRRASPATSSSLAVVAPRRVLFPVSTAPSARIVPPAPRSSQRAQETVMTGALEGRVAIIIVGARGLVARRVDHQSTLLQAGAGAAPAVGVGRMPEIGIGLVPGEGEA